MAVSRSKTKAMIWGRSSGSSAGRGAGAGAGPGAGAAAGRGATGAGSSRGRPNTRNESMVCFTPSSKTSKSEALRSRTARPFLSRTTMSRVTAAVPTPKVGTSCGLWGTAGASWGPVATTGTPGKASMLRSTATRSGLRLMATSQFCCRGGLLSYGFTPTDWGPDRAARVARSSFSNSARSRAASSLRPARW